MTQASFLPRKRAVAGSKQDYQTFGTPGRKLLKDLAQLLNRFLGKSNGILTDLHSIIPFALLWRTESRKIQLITKPHSLIEMKNDPFQ
jgi:hypothetical protein